MKPNKKSTYTYEGAELDFFAHAQNWKEYFFKQIQRYLGNRVLEVGAGKGKTTQTICRAVHDLWICLDPDLAHLDEIRKLIHSGELPSFLKKETFDTILYIDVLEHIDEDHFELTLAANRLNVGGKLIVLSPAHQWLYSSFDKAIGHHRRYSKWALRATTPDTLDLIDMRCLDSAGLFASIANRFILRQPMVTMKNIEFWDQTLVPISRVTDRLTGYLFGKTVLGVWEKKVTTL
jgi:SAM-dependent methyltransferase